MNNQFILLNVLYHNYNLINYENKILMYNTSFILTWRYCIFNEKLIKYLWIILNLLCFERILTIKLFKNEKYEKKEKKFKILYE